MASSSCLRWDFAPTAGNGLVFDPLPGVFVFSKSYHFASDVASAVQRMTARFSPEFLAGRPESGDVALLDDSGVSLQIHCEFDGLAFASYYDLLRVLCRCSLGAQEVV